MDEMDEIDEIPNKRNPAILGSVCNELFVSSINKHWNILKGNKDNKRRSLYKEITSS